ncbi:hypothetical protein [Scytonema sp. PRP1]|uniref:hypothetical protein n=1 Tax=Scytonema sp. PRP1 TaxID=3120513 RepID=UPI00300D4484
MDWILLSTAFHELVMFLNAEERKGSAAKSSAGGETSAAGGASSAGGFPAVGDWRRFPDLGNWRTRRGFPT